MGSAPKTYHQAGADSALGTRTPARARMVVRTPQDSCATSATQPTGTKSAPKTYHQAGADSALGTRTPARARMVVRTPQDSCATSATQPTGTKSAPKTYQTLSKLRLFN